MRSKKVVNIFKQTKLSKFQDVPHPLLLRFQITNIVFVGLNHDGDPLGDGDAVSLQTHNLFGVVGHQAHLPDTQIYQDLRANAIIPQIRLEAQLDIYKQKCSSAPLCLEICLSKGDEEAAVKKSLNWIRARFREK